MKNEFATAHSLLPRADGKPALRAHSGDAPVPLGEDARWAGEGPSLASSTYGEIEPSSGPADHLLPVEEGTAIPRADKVLAAATWDASEASDRVLLDYEGRHRRRFRYLGERGTEFNLDLQQTTLLHDGDGLQLDDGRIVLVAAADEALVAITASDAAALVRLAWHIGNRHLPAQISPERILIRDDAVINHMLRGLGAHVEPIVAAFTPERGAYASGHAHDDELQAHPFVRAPGHKHGR